MNDNTGNRVADFCEQVQVQLETLQGRIDSLKKNVGTTCHLLQQRLAELQQKNDTEAPSVADARERIEQWMHRKPGETSYVLEQWIENHESGKLEERARHAEDCAVMAIRLAEVGIDDAERMILEAVAARRDAEAVSAV